MEENKHKTFSGEDI